MTDIVSHFMNHPRDDFLIKVTILTLALQDNDEKNAEGALAPTK